MQVAPLTNIPAREIIVHTSEHQRALLRISKGSFMDDFNRKVENASARVGKTVSDATERLEKEIPEFIKYLNDEVVPAVRTHSTKALRTASQRLTEFADYMEQHHQHPPK